MKTGVVILNYNVADAVITLANRFLLFFDVDNIVIVDNASKESDREKITEYYSNQKNSKLKFIQSSVNGGYARGNNIGLRWLVEKCECDICFISNPDIDIKQEDFTKIISAFRHSNTFSVLTCKREYSNGQSIRQHWQLAAYKTLIMECFYIYRCFEKKNYIYDVDTRYPVISIEVAPGAFWAIRSETLRKVNYLDEGTFLYYEEMCFGKKINLIGEKEGLVTDASYTVHIDKASTSKIRDNGQGYIYLLDSKDFYIKKYLTKKRWMIFLWNICKNIALWGNRVRHLRG